MNKNFDIENWTDGLTEKIFDTFSDRVQFIGLQGSYQRGEATAESDIDIVLILDTIDLADMLLYKKLIAAMPFHNKACGFICGKNELMNWPKHDLFQLYHDTKPLYKEMSHLIPEISNEDIKQSVTIGTANLYHAVSHSYIYGNNNALSLMKLLKGTFYILQAKHRLETGNYVKSRTELSTKLSGLDKEIIDLSNNRKMLAAKSSIEIDQCYSVLMNWCQNILHTYQ